MSDLGKKKDSNREEPIDELKQQLEDCVAEIKKTLGNKKDLQDVDSTAKQKLSREYLRASQLARKIASRVPDISDAEKYNELSEKLGKRATDFGSTVRSKIPDTTFDDVKGLKGAKEIVKSFLFLAQNQEILNYYKIQGGLGMLMYGPPGTGKTMFAEAIANALRLPLFVVTPADIFSKYVGASEQAVKQLFDEIDACPDGAILFVDECESIFSKRSEDTQDYKAAVTTELLQRINGFGVSGNKRMIIAATNRPEIIDPAYLRYKRFSHLVLIGPPEEEARRCIIESKLEGIDLADDISLEEIVAMTECSSERETQFGTVERLPYAYYSAADICGIIEEACRLAIEDMQQKNISMPIPLTRKMFESAFAKIKPSISAELLRQYEDFR